MLQTCPTCSGAGAVQNIKTGQGQQCPACQGAGTVSGGYDDQDFWYPIKPPALTANQTGVIATVTIDNDADFLCDRFIANSTGLFSVTLFDKFRSRPFSPNTSINGENIAGTAQLPMWLSNPFLIRKNAVIQGTFNDRSGAGNTIEFNLVGRKLMP
jgi:hypothetical protein